MFCTACGKTVPDTDRFCCYCGAVLEAPVRRGVGSEDAAPPARERRYEPDPAASVTLKTTPAALNALLGLFLALALLLLLAALPLHALANEPGFPNRLDAPEELFRSLWPLLGLAVLTAAIALLLFPLNAQRLRSALRTLGAGALIAGILALAGAVLLPRAESALLRFAGPLLPDTLEAGGLLLLALGALLLSAASCARLLRRPDAQPHRVPVPVQLLSPILAGLAVVALLGCTVLYLLHVGQ